MESFNGTETMLNITGLIITICNNVLSNFVSVRVSSEFKQAIIVRNRILGVVSSWSYRPTKKRKHAAEREQ